MRHLQLNKLQFAGQSSLQEYLIVALYFFILSLVVRLPFFFNAVFDWDESTYILMGQFILDGHLPYIDFWELKPPLVFLTYASFIAIFGKSIVSVRLGGAICVAVTSLLLYSIGKTLWNFRVGILAGTLSVFLETLISGGKSTMTEHIALVPLIGALSLLITQKKSFITLFCAGILMGAASFIRLNLAYVALTAGFFILLIKPRKPVQLIWKRGLAYGAGNCLVVAVLYLPYFITGNHKIWWNSVFIAPLNYSNAQFSILQTLLKHINYILESVTIFNIRPLTGISILVWLGGLAGIVLLTIQWKNTSTKKRSNFALLALFFIVTGISILKGGGNYSHYLIQIVPLMALTAASFLDFLFLSPVRWLTIVAVVWSLWMAMLPSFEIYRAIVPRLLTGQTLNFGAAYEIAGYLAQENPLNEPIYLMTDHIVYWFLDTKPITKYVHPSIISKEFLLETIVGTQSSTEQEMAKVLGQEPQFIVKTEKVRYLRFQKNALLLLENTLQEEYDLVKIIQGRQIYRKN